MANERKSRQSIKTMASLVDRRRLRTVAGAHLEMSVLANERMRLQQEANRLRNRLAEIEARFAEITEKESRLCRFVKDPQAAAAAEARPIPVSEAPRRMRVRELRY